MKFIYFFICSSVGLLYSQDIVVTESNMIKVTYEHHTHYSPLGNYDTYLYLTDGLSQYVKTQKEKIVKPAWNYEYKMNFVKNINNFNFLTGAIEENRTLKDSTLLYAKWNVSDLIWTITDEEKTINGYNVRKATTDSFELEIDDPFYYNKAIAWFTTDIPIPVGPARYYGLPGLIVELEYERGSLRYVLKDIDFQAHYKFIEINKENEVDKYDVIYYDHKNPKLIKNIQKQNKKNKNKK